MKIPIAKEGIQYGIMPFILGIIFLFVKFPIIGTLFILFSMFFFLFFRYPDREVLSDKSCIYAPADGKVLCIKDESEDTFLKDVVHRISIFMSVFNVHINYAPIHGVVEYMKYTPGKFIRADVININENNENNYIGLSSEKFKIGVRQVAGWIARRIVCDCKEGDILSAGKRFGLIQFGSRVDVFMPKDYVVCVKIGESVRAGRTVIGRCG